MRPELRTSLQALGAELSPTMIQGSTALMAAIAAPRDPAVEVIRDRQYGPDERNRLDIFRKGQPAGAPVLVYVHGGGFVMGDKTSPGSPFYDNFGQWAAARGMLGVTLTYRLAPKHRWPCGPEDMARAVTWLRAHIGAYGGDPEAIFLVGQSAGATHVAAYLADPRWHAQGAIGLAGAVMISGIYDGTAWPPGPFSDAYYGEGTPVPTAANHLPGLVACPLPQLFTVSEFDARDFQDQAVRLVQAWHQQRGGYPPLEYLAGHNHISPAQSLGSVEQQLAGRLLDFVAASRP